MTKLGGLAIEARKLCTKYPDSPNLTLARVLAKATGLKVERCRTAIRDTRGANGNRRRRTATQKELFKDPGKAGSIPQCPPSMAQPWLPHVIKLPAKVGIVSDLHFPFHSELAVQSAVEYLVAEKIDTLLINGDFGDWYAPSRFQTNPALRDFPNELKSQREAFQWIRKCFPKQEIIFKLGNHDERWDKYVWNHFPELHAEEQLRLSTWLKLDDLGIEVVTDQRPVLIGKLPVFHGHELPKGLTNPVNMARGAFLRACHTVMVGHGHRTSTHVESDLWHDEITCWSTGCLCDMRPEYARINKWNWGFATAEAAKDGTFGVQNLRISKQGVVRSS